MSSSVRRVDGVPGGIGEPVPRPLQRLLRRAVLDHATSERRRQHPCALHVGVPGLRSRRFEVRPDDRLDHALRVEAVEAMLRRDAQRGVVPLIWLTRPAGDDPLEPRDSDHAWAAAVQAAGGELGMELPLVVVTRRSWRDPRTGAARVWQRIRDR